MEASGGGGIREEQQKVMSGGGGGGLKGSALIRDKEGLNGQTDMETCCPHTCCFIYRQH